ncbi:MAG: inositol monophosphatase family protein [Sphingomonadales bacterium]
MAFRSADINVMAGAAYRAARRLVRDFGEVEQLQVSKKGPADFVTNADLMAEKTILRELQHARPAYGLLMEEKGAIKGEDPDCRWVVDPLDGTTNFLHGIPHFAISIALEVRGEITAGIVYQPLTDELYWAEKGRGAHVNDRRLRVSARREFRDAVIATGIPHLGRGSADEFSHLLRVVMAEVAGVRRFGAASLDLAYVAAGRFDGFWETGLERWDIAAGSLIVREAGGFVSDINGGEGYMKSGDIVAANDPLHPKLTKLLNGTRRDYRSKA